MASLTLLSPAGLWKRDTPLYCRVSLRVTRWLARHAAGPLSRLVNFRLGRILALGQTHGHPTRLTPGYARAAIQAMGTCPGFEAALAATARRRFLATAPIGAPVTLAFGSRDVLLLPRQSRHLDQLPAGTRQKRCPAAATCRWPTIPPPSPPHHQDRRAGRTADYALALAVKAALA